jgi:flagellar P-ring protein precursor FlgI
MTPTPDRRYTSFMFHRRLESLTALGSVALLSACTPDFNNVEFACTERYPGRSDATDAADAYADLDTAIDTTATRIAKAVNAYLGKNAAQALDPSNVELNVPAGYAGGVMALLTDIEQVKVDPDQGAKVVIAENSGVIVMGADVRISTVAIAQGNLTIKVTETPQVSQPAPFSQTGTTEVVPRTSIQVDDSKGNRMAVLRDGVSLQHVVDGLNALGVGPRDIISILQAIKAAGALQAEIEVIG